MTSTSITFLFRYSIIFLLSLCTGCIWIPRFGTRTGIDAGQKVGDRDSGKPLRVGVATRSDISHWLGNPVYTSLDKNTLVYRWERLWGSWLGMGEASVTTYAVEIAFDERGIVSRVQRYKRHYKFDWLFHEHRVYVADKKHVSAEWLDEEFGPMKAFANDPSTRPSSMRSALRLIVPLLPP